METEQVLVQTSLAKTDLEEHPPLRALRSKADGRKGLQDGNLGDFPKVWENSRSWTFLLGHFCVFFFLVGNFSKCSPSQMTKWNHVNCGI